MTAPDFKTLKEGDWLYVKKTWTRQGNPLGHRGTAAEKGDVLIFLEFKRFHSSNIEVFGGYFSAIGPSLETWLFFVADNEQFTEYFDIVKSGRKVVVIDSERL